MPSQKEIVDAVSKQLEKKDLSQQAVMVLQRATGKVLDRIKQNVDAQVKEDSSPIVEEFVKNVATKLSAMTQQWHDGITNDLAIFPEGTRYIFRDGNMQTLVVEQPPQVRTINYNGINYGLAFPYTQFIIQFNGHRPVGHLFVGMTKKPISDLDSPMYDPPVPNTGDHSVCMGNFQWPQSGSMTEMANKIIGGFWMSQFNDSGSHGAFVQFLRDNGLTLESWVEQSKADPLFVVAKKTKFKQCRTVRAYLAHDNGGKAGTVSLVNNLKMEIINAVGSIGGDIQKMLTEVDLKTENREKAHIEVLQGVLKEIIVQAYKELWEFLQKQLQEERAKLQSEMEAAAKKLKTDFMYYMDSKGRGQKGSW